MVWTPGNERIPTPFYKRHPTDLYNLLYFANDITYFSKTVPQIFAVGCNQGKINSYDTISIEALTGGAYTAPSLASNPLCFSAQLLIGAGSSLLGLSSELLTQLQQALQPLLTAGSQSCPVILNPDLSQLKACPGFSEYGGPEGNVAPGAIQS